MVIFYLELLVRNANSLVLILIKVLNVVVKVGFLRLPRVGAKRLHPVEQVSLLNNFPQLLQISDQRSHILNAVKALENTNWFRLTSLTELNTYLK